MNPYLRVNENCPGNLGGDFQVASNNRKLPVGDGSILRAGFTYLEHCTFLLVYPTQQVIRTAISIRSCELQWPAPAEHGQTAEADCVYRRPCYKLIPFAARV